MSSCRLHPVTPYRPQDALVRFPSVQQPCQQQTEESLGGEKAWHYAMLTHLAQAQSSPMGSRDSSSRSPGVTPWRTPPSSHPATAEGHQQEPKEAGPCPVAFTSRLKKKKILLGSGLGPWGVKVSRRGNKGGFTSPSTLPPSRPEKNDRRVHISF